MTSTLRARTVRRQRLANFVQLTPAILWAATLAIPMVYLVIVTFRTRQQYSQDPLGLPTGINLENYARAWEQGNLQTAFINNVVVTALSVAGIVLFASLAAYGIARWRGRAGRGIFVYFILGLMVPFQLGLPTLYKIWAQAGLVDTLFGLVLIHIGAGMPIAIFLYCGFLLTVPLELEESARVDGAGDVRTFVSVVFPLLRPVTATVVILTSISVWNDLIVALFFLQSPETQTLPRAAIGFQNLYSTDLPVVFACAVLTVVPIVVLFSALQRFFLSGLISGALRG